MAFLGTNNKLSGRESKKTIAFTIATTTTTKIRCLGINLTKEVKDLCSENFNPPKKEIEEVEAYTVLMDEKN